MRTAQSYVGDGVYAEFFADGGLRLWTERRSGTHEIYFEPGMLELLVKLHGAARARLAQPQPEAQP